MNKRESRWISHFLKGEPDCIVIGTVARSAALLPEPSGPEGPAAGSGHRRSAGPDAFCVER